METKSRENERIIWGQGLSEEVMMEFEPGEFNPGIWTRLSRSQLCNHSTNHFSFLWLWYDTILPSLLIYYFHHLTCLSNPLTWDDWPLKEKKKPIVLSTLILTAFCFLTTIYSVALSYFQLLCLVRRKKIDICYTHVMCILWIFVVSIALRMRWLDSITDSMDLNLSNLGNSRGQRSLASIVKGVAESLTQLGSWRTWNSTELLTNSPEFYVWLGCFGRWGSWTAAEKQTITDAPFMSSPTFYGLYHVTSLSPYLWFSR